MYGTDTLESIETSLARRFGAHDISFFQSNIEGEIVDALQEADSTCDGVVLNAGGYSHTSVAIRDAIDAISTPVVEVHISNIFSRESFRQKSLLSAVCAGHISGLGPVGYTLAVLALTESAE